MELKMNLEFGRQNEKNAKFDIELINELPIIMRSSPSTTCSDSYLLPLPEVFNKDLSEDKCSNDHDAIDEFDSTFVNSSSSNKNNNISSSSNVRRVSFLRSPMPSNNLNTSNTSRGNVRRWSQSLTSAAKTAKTAKAAKAKQQRTIHVMPSRLQKLPTALSMDGQFLRIVPGEANIEDFVQEIEQHDYLLEDSAPGEQLRITTLRALPQALSIKRRIKSKVTQTVRHKSRELGTNRWKRAVHFIGLCKTKAKIFLRNVIRNAELWYDSMKEIEGHFGGDVGTYFQFLRFLFALNAFLMVTTLIFIIFPQLLDDYFKDKNVIVTIPELFFSPSANKSNIDRIKVMDLFTAQGFLENTLLFYGSYATEKINLNNVVSYCLPYAYLMTMVSLYAATFVILSIAMAQSYRKSFIETSGGESMHAHKLFCSWDFGISNQRAADMKRCSIYNELKTILDELYETDYDLPIWHKFGEYVISIMVWIFVISILIGIGYLIGYLKVLQHFDESDFPTYFLSSVLFVPVMVTILILWLQTLFEWLATLEHYKSTRSQLHIALVRNYLLEIVTMTSLVVFWLSKDKKELQKLKCWETTIGQEIYRFVMVDFLLVGCLGSVLHIVRYLIHKYVWTEIGLSEFSISRGSLGLIFNQTLLWIGLFFSPLLATIVIAKMVFTFYLKKIILINFCKTPSKLWRSAQTFTLFLAMTFVSLTIIIAALLFVLTQMPVSRSCGPFRNHKFMFHVISGDILKLQENHFLWQLIMFLVRPAAIGGVLLFLCVLVYYLRTKSRARIEMVKVLKEMLFIEAKDKEFLLTNITRVTQGNDWLLEDLRKNTKILNRRLGRIDDYAETSLTWQHHNNNDVPNISRNEDDGGNLSKQNSLRSTISSVGSSSNGLTMDVENLRKRRTSLFD